jgi:hypothetical protein
VTHAHTPADVAAAVAALRKHCRLPVDPARRGPVPLARFLDERNLLHATLTTLTRAAVVSHLGFLPDVEFAGDAGEVLAGCLLRTGADGHVFVGEREPYVKDGERKLRFTTQPRQRFTTAHELGHFELHGGRMSPFVADTKESVVEDEDTAQAAAMEREANRFAALLLMPEEVCRARGEEFRKAYGVCPRAAFGYHLAAELLVSPQAMRTRLKELGVGDE